MTFPYWQVALAGVVAVLLLGAVYLVCVLIQRAIDKANEGE